MNFKNSKTFFFKDQKLVLLPGKALYWKESKMLIISDVHFGKSGHFRKHGIAVPNSVNTSNIHRLDEIINLTQPEKIVFLEDLFHSDANNEIEHFKEWRQSHASTHVILTLGNHDILTRFEFEKMGLECVNQYAVEPFVFVHDQTGHKPKTFYPISGHLHPAIKLTGKGRQTIYAPCFYFGGNFGILPAFGSFTGNYRIKPAQNESVFVVVKNEVLDISENFSQD